jgi:hypothetical protein
MADTPCINLRSFEKQLRRRIICYAVWIQDPERSFRCAAVFPLEKPDLWRCKKGLIISLALCFGHTALTVWWPTHSNKSLYTCLCDWNNSAVTDTLGRHPLDLMKHTWRIHRQILAENLMKKSDSWILLASEYHNNSFGACPFAK